MNMEEDLEIAGPMKEPLMEDIVAEKISRQDSFYLSDTDDSNPNSPIPVRAQIYRIFGREQPVHKVLGGGKPADLLLWRDKKVSATLLTAVTVIWALFEFGGYNFVTFICHGLMFFLALSFLLSNVLAFMNKSSEYIPELYIPEEPLLLAISAFMVDLNYALTVIRRIALERDLTMFLMVNVGLWFVSIIGNWFSFLSLVYICCVLVHTVPKLYEKYEDDVDLIAEKAMIEIEKRYQVLQDNVLSKIPISHLKSKSN